MNIRSIYAVITFLVSTLLLTACNTPMHEQTTPNTTYLKALERTDPANYNLPAPDSPEELAMVERVRNLFETYNYEHLEQNIEQVYASEVYFRDAFKQFGSAKEIKDYMLAGLDPLEGAEFVFNRVAMTEGNYYFDWTMRLDFKKTPSGTWEESIGISHMRFNNDGKVIFHQDYWDPTDIVYRRIPIAKQLIAFVKKKL